MYLIPHIELFEGYFPKQFRGISHENAPQCVPKQNMKKLALKRKIIHQIHIINY